MATASIGGLASGLDTATIVDQLMQLEAIPRTKLATQVSTERTRVNALQQVNTALSTLASVAKSLATASGSAGTWGALSTTSSSKAISASADSTATPGSLTVKVEVRATSASTSVQGVTPTANSTFTVRGPGDVPVVGPDGRPVTIKTDADPTLAEFAAAINATTDTTSLRAVVVHGAAGDVLQIGSTKTGVASNFSLTDGTQTFAASNGVDGRIRVNDVVVTGASNTYEDAVDGLTITLGSDAVAGTESTITVSRDAASRSDAVKTLVDNVNSVLSMIATQSSVNADRSKSGALAGDATVRRAATELVSSLYPGGNVSMSQFGLGVDRSGRITFDSAKFTEAYAADPAAVTAALTGPDGFGARVQEVAEAASDKYDGYVTSAITGRNDSIKRLNASIEAWDARLELRRSSLERTYTALETALSRLNSQASWLSGQISSLSANSGQ